MHVHVNTKFLSSNNNYVDVILCSPFRLYCTVLPSGSLCVQTFTKWQFAKVNVAALASKYM